MRFHDVAVAIAATAVGLAATACAQAVNSNSPSTDAAAGQSVEDGSPRQSVATDAPAPLARALQLIVFVAPDWTSTTGTLRRFARPDVDTPWRLVESAIPAVIGRTGLAWADAALATDMHQPVKHEGDGKSPAGAFPIDTAFGFAPRSELSWLRMPYAPLAASTDCVDDEASAYYNTVVDRSSVARVDWTSAEHMRQVGQYRLGLIVGYNANPPQRGRGSCIFVHIWGGPSSTTAGCTALDAGQLEQIMRWLDAARRPVIVQLPVTEFERLRAAWQLPAL